jgi:hypothetical protein
MSVTHEHDFFNIFAHYLNENRIRERGGGWCDTNCPFHDDRHPSFSFSRHTGYWLCRAGCGAGRALDFIKRVENLNDAQAIDRLRELCGGKLPEGIALHSDKPTRDAFAIYCKVPWMFLDELGIKDTERGLRIPYLDQSGNVVRYRYRTALTGAAKYTWAAEGRIIPYGVWNLDVARQKGYVILVEGETDALVGIYLGVPVLGIPGCEAWKSEWLHFIPEGVTAYIWQEPGTGGAKFAERVAKDIPEARIVSPPDGIKDLRALWLHSANAGDFSEKLDAILSSAKTPSDFEAARRRTELEQARQRAAELMACDDILAEAMRTCRDLGIAGDLNPAAVIFLALCSRVLRRPANLHINAPSGTGKTFTTEVVCQLFPADCVYRWTATSERAIVYDESDFKHRAVVVSEAAALHRDGVGAVILRELMWGQRLVYVTVEKTKNGLRVRRIEKEGPTNIITTSVKQLEAELCTRTLLLEIDDSQKQTKEILLRTGRDAATFEPAEPDLGPWHALQRVLQYELAGVRVVVPYAEVLAEHYPPHLVRARRDFVQLLMLIESHAVLNAHRRTRLDSKTLIADLEDYEAIYEIASDLFRTGRVASFTPKQMEAITKLYEMSYVNEATQQAVSLNDLAHELNIDRTSAMRRLAPAIEQGVAEVISGGPGGRGRETLVVCRQLPESGSALPRPEVVRHEVKKCAVGVAG